MQVVASKSLHFLRLKQTISVIFTSQVKVTRVVDSDPHPTYGYEILQGQCHEIFYFWFFSWISFPQALEYTIRAVSNFFENSRRYSQLKVDHRYQRHRRQNCRRYQRHQWQICHRYQRHRRQILPPFSLVLLIPVANNRINIRLQIP